MKKFTIYIFTIALFTISLESKGQDKTITLNTILTGATYDKAARDQINLTPGFIYKAQTGKTFTGRIDENMICTPEYITQIKDGATRALNTSYAVGSIPGNFDVSPIGAATYRIPIELPAGLNDLAPSVEISYHSQAGNGLLGWGWSLNAASRISRGTTSHLQENYIDAIAFDGNDRFYLDGNRLILVNGTYGANDAEYRTETDTYARIKSYGGANNNPDKFVVWTKDGKKIEYGSTASTRLSTAEGNVLWYIEKVSDYDGNTISYTYANDNNGFRIESITYAGNTVQFLYEARNDVNTLYYSGLTLEKNIILRGIKVNSQGTKFREYDFTYFDDNYTKLNEIIEYGSDGSRFNSTVVNWGNSNGGSFLDNINIESEHSFHYLGEFNGDGQTDLFIMPDKETYNVNDQWKILVANASGNGFNNFSSGYIPYNSTKALCNDFNGDGLTDILFFTEDEAETENIMYGDKRSSTSQTINRTISNIQNMRVSSGISDQYQLVLKLNTGSSFSTSNLSLTNNKGQIHAGDFNGDGICDLLFWDAVTNPSANVYKLYYGQTNGTFTSYGPGSIGTKSSATCIGEFNGDGKMDLMVFLSNSIMVYDFTNGIASELFSSNSINKYHYVYLGDFNGDGRSDVLSRISGSSWRVRYTTENGFDSKSIGLNPLFHPSDSLDIIVADLNGDLKSDIIEVKIDRTYRWNGRANIPDTYKTYTDVHYSYGTQFIKTSPNTFADSWGVPDFQIGDFNGDGIDDPFAIYSKRVTDLYYFETDNQKNLVTSIANGMGIVRNITYSYLAKKNDIYTKDATSSYPLIAHQGSNYVVKTVVKKYDTHTLDNVNYIYEGALVNKRDKEFLGFRKITATNSVKATEVANNYSFIAPLYTSYVSNQTVKHNNILLKTLTINNSLTSVIALNSTRYYRFYKVSSSNKDELTNVTVTSTNSAFDSYQFPTTVQTTYGNDLTVTSNYAYDHVTTANHWLIGRAQSTTVTKKHKDDPGTHVRKTYLNFNATYPYRLDNIDEDYDQSSYSVKKIFGSYNSNGLPTAITLRAQNQSATDRTTTLSYDPTGRFIAQKTMELGHTVKYTYDNLGNNVSLTDANNKTTTFKYDGFGRLIETHLPDGNSITHSLSWEISSQNETTHKSITTTSGQSPLTRYYNELGNVVLEESYGYNSQLVKVETRYDSKGRVTHQSMPFTGSAAEYTVHTYQTDGRLDYTTLPAGRGTINYEYTAGSTKVKVTHPTGWTEKTFDAAGLIDLVKDPGGEINYEYYSSALPHYVNYKDQNNNINQIELEYDHKGNRTKIIDPDIGTVDNTYNPFGELLSHTENSNTYYMEYDKLGRLISRSKNGTGNEPTEWIYDESRKGVLDRMLYNNTTAVEYTYDDYRRLTKQKEYIDTKTFETSYEYNSYGQISKLTYPGGFAITNVYDAYGYLTGVNRTSDSKQLWYAPQANALGQFTSYQYGNGAAITRTYDSYHLPNIMKAYKSATQLFEWDFNFASDGNLQQRKDVKNGNQTENFTFDNLDRLSAYKEGTITYKAEQNGNIDYKPNVGDYQYDHATKKHAVTSITNPELPETVKTRNMTYTGFNKIQQISEEINGKHYEMDFTYGPDYARKQTKLTEDASLVKTTYYAGGLFEEVKSEGTGETKRYHYIMGGDGLAAIYISGTDPGTGNMYYVHKDYLGSILALSDENGTIAEQYSFDAWGNCRNPSDWTQADTRTGLLINRGYTGHEHMDPFSLINMNGRVYDPMLGRFLSPDPFMQAPDYSQNFNRYSYVFNNPMRYTDPSGYIPNGAEAGRRYPDGSFNNRNSGSESMFNQVNDLSGQSLRTETSYIIDDFLGDLNLGAGSAVYWITYHFYSYLRNKDGSLSDPTYAGSHSWHIWNPELFKFTPAEEDFVTNSGGEPGLPTVDGQTGPWSPELLDKLEAKHAVGPGLVAIGGPWIPKNSAFARMIFSRSAAVMGTKQTTTSLFSLSAHGLSKRFGLSFIGGTTTKAVPIIGWVWTAHDVLRLTVPAYDQFHIDFERAQQLPGSGPAYIGSDGIYVCFVAGTKIYADKGLVDIETLREGMKVYSYNFESEQLELKPITKLYKRDVQEVYNLTIGKEEINVTSEHPFYVEGKGWVKVKDLKESDLLRTSKDKRKEIKKITKKQQAVTVYNIEVDGNHNYFVGKLKVLVHNK